MRRSRSCVLLLAWGIAVSAPDSLARSSTELAAQNLPGTSTATVPGAPILTGKSTIELLLEARIASDETAGGSSQATGRSGRSAGAAGASYGDGLGTTKESLRDALRRDAVTQAGHEAYVNDLNSRGRSEVEPTPWAATRPDSDTGRRQSSNDGEYTGLWVSKPVLDMLREYRFWVLGAALVLVAVAWAMSVRTSGRRSSPAPEVHHSHSSGRRRRRHRSK